MVEFYGRVYPGNNWGIDLFYFRERVLNKKQRKLLQYRYPEVKTAYLRKIVKNTLQKKYSRKGLNKLVNTPLWVTIRNKNTGGFFHTTKIGSFNF